MILELICAIAASSHFFDLRDPISVDNDSSRPYCGLYCVYSVLSSRGVHCNFEDLIRREFVPTRAGSTSSAIQQALAQYGVNSIQVNSASLSQLYLLNRPAVLHTRIPADEDGYGHWVLFLGFNDDGVKIYDPPRGVAVLSAAELASIWDGHAVVVTESDWLDSTVGFAPIEAITLSLITLGTLRAMRHRFSSIFVLTGTTVFTSTVFCLFMFVSGWFDIRSVSNIPQARIDYPIHKIEKDELAKLLTNPESVELVDVRSSMAFDSGSIPRSRNIPITTGYVDMKSAIAGLPMDRPIVVFCQNDRCSWSEIMARIFIAQGRSRVYVYRGGYAEWIRSMRPNQSGTQQPSAQ